MRLVCPPFFQPVNSNIFSNVSKLNLLKLSSERKHCVEISSPDYLQIYCDEIDFFCLNQIWQFNISSFLCLGLFSRGSSYLWEQSDQRVREPLSNATETWRAPIIQNVERIGHSFPLFSRMLIGSFKWSNWNLLNFVKKYYERSWSWCLFWIVFWLCGLDFFA